MGKVTFKHNAEMMSEALLYDGAPVLTWAQKNKVLIGKAAEFMDYYSKEGVNIVKMIKVISEINFANEQERLVFTYCCGFIMTQTNSFFKQSTGELLYLHRNERPSETIEYCMRESEPLMGDLSYLLAFFIAGTFKDFNK